jgi:hypothetical protein
MSWPCGGVEMGSGSSCGGGVTGRIALVEAGRLNDNVGATTTVSAGIVVAEIIVGGVGCSSCTGVSGPSIEVFGSAREVPRG